MWHWQERLTKASREPPVDAVEIARCQQLKLKHHLPHSIWCREKCHNQKNNYDGNNDLQEICVRKEKKKTEAFQVWLKGKKGRERMQPKSDKTMESSQPVYNGHQPHRKMDCNIIIKKNISNDAIREDTTIEDKKKDRLKNKHHFQQWLSRKDAEQRFLKEQKKASDKKEAINSRQEKMQKWKKNEIVCAYTCPQ